MAIIDQFIVRRGADAVSAKILKLAFESTTNNVLLIGGNDYVQKLVQLSVRKYQPVLKIQPFNLYIINHLTDGYKQLRDMVGGSPGVVTLNEYPSDAVMSHDDVVNFYSNNPDKQRVLTLNDAFNVRAEEKKTFKRDGVNHLIDTFSITSFDLVISDGAWLTSTNIYDDTIGAKYYILLDTNTIKNADAFAAIAANSGEYERLTINGSIELDNAYNNGNGVALFRLKV